MEEQRTKSFTTEAEEFEGTLCRISAEFVRSGSTTIVEGLCPRVEPLC